MLRMVLFFHASFVSLSSFFCATLLFSTLLYSTSLHPILLVSLSLSIAYSLVLYSSTNEAGLGTSYFHCSLLFFFFFFLNFLLLFLISLLILNIPERKVYWSILGTFQFEKSKFITYQLRTNLAKGSIYVLGKLAETRESLLIECKLQQYPQNKQKKKKRKKGRKKRRKRRREEKRK